MLLKKIKNTNLFSRANDECSTFPVGEPSSVVEGNNQGIDHGEALSFRPG